MAQATGTVSGTGMMIYCNVDGINLPHQVDYVMNTFGYGVSTACIVPVNSTYVIGAWQTSGAVALTQWTELR